MTNYLGKRKTDALELRLCWLIEREFLSRFPHEHNAARLACGHKRSIAIAVVSGWVGQGRVAVRYIGQKDTKWDIFDYPNTTRLIEVMEDPCLEPSKPASSWGSGSGQSDAPVKSSNPQEPTSTT